MIVPAQNGACVLAPIRADVLLRMLLALALRANVRCLVPLRLSPRTAEDFIHVVLPPYRPPDPYRARSRPDVLLTFLYGGLEEGYHRRIPFFKADHTRVGPKNFPQ